MGRAPQQCRPKAEHATDRGLGICRSCWPLDVIETEGNEQLGNEAGQAPRSRMQRTAQCCSP